MHIRNTGLLIILTILLIPIILIIPAADIIARLGGNPEYNLPTESFDDFVTVGMSVKGRYSYARFVRTVLAASSKHEHQ
jgi:hypothetical protein